MSHVPKAGTGAAKRTLQPPAPPNAPASDELEPAELPGGGEVREIDLAEALVDHAGREAVTTTRVAIEESELRAVALGEGTVNDFLIRDTRLRGCDLSNVAARRGEIRRVASVESKLIGFALIEGELGDARFEGGSAMLSSFAHAKLRRVEFHGVNLREAVFVSAELDSVLFQDCDLTGADFRGAQLRNCVIRGSSLDGVSGVESMRGLAMPWPELLDSAGTMAAALGISVDEEED